MFEIGKTFKFEAAHCLLHHDGKCRRPHGHSYQFELVVESSDVQLEGAKAGMVDDYDLLTEAGSAIEQMLDHRDLNEVLDSDTTTAEEISSFIFRQVRRRLPNLVEVRVKETAKTYASYRPRRAEERRAVEIGKILMDEARERLYEGIDRSDPDACWSFAGAKDEGGYGWCSFSLAGTKKAHRLSAWLAGDDVEDKVVLHTCDNPSCVNPAHLVTGTHEQNEADKDAKGRRPIGERHGAARLTEADARSIVERVAGGEARRSVAASLGVSTSLISAIMSGRAWRHVTKLPRP